jgi:hypothetical protein
MAIGEVVGEARGKVAGLRALENGKIEVTLQGTGKILGVDIGDVTSFWSEMRPNGTAYGEGHSIHMGSDGMAEWKGSGIGKQTGPGAWKYSYGGAFKKATSPKWATLLEVYTIGEYEADANGNYRWKLWEWKY